MSAFNIHSCGEIKRNTYLDTLLVRNYRIQLHFRNVSPRLTEAKSLLITKTCLFKYILKILSPKNENFQIKNSDSFHISAQNIDCEYSLELPQQGSSNKYQQSMFLSRNMKTIRIFLSENFHF